ncbi:MAG: hypothetical protein QOK37_3310 [Thermoanaerobaculia bacterium]|nr:hypothetical protein [Thermoanaerobaculia bacterium]
MLDGRQFAKVTARTRNLIADLTFSARQCIARHSKSNIQHSTFNILF